MAKKKTVRRNGKVLHGAAAMAVLKSRAKKARKAASKKRSNPGRPATKKKPAKKRSNPARPATKKKATKKKSNPATKKKPAKKRRNGPQRYWYQVTAKRNGILYGQRVPHRNPSRAPEAIIKLHEDFLGRPISEYQDIEVPSYFPDDAVNAGDVVAIEYLAAKDHLEDGEMIHWRHEFGEEGGDVPIMAISEDGSIFLAGGDYWIAPEGIRD